jgi:dTDP-4-dehydrorhamnose 3,5-epimerase
MNVIPTAIPDVLILEPKIFGDDRGFFFESFNEKVFREKTGVEVNFVQDNHSKSVKNVLRGLHYQLFQPQGKLVRVITGAILDIAVDIRQNSPTFSQWVGVTLSEENKQQLWIPPGFAHGFLVLSEGAEVLYKATDYYFPQGDRCIIWNDPDLKIDWNLKENPILSTKDQQGKSFKEADIFP